MKRNPHYRSTRCLNTATNPLFGGIISESPGIINHAILGGYRCMIGFEGDEWFPPPSPPTISHDVAHFMQTTHLRNYFVFVSRKGRDIVGDKL